MIVREFVRNIRHSIAIDIVLILQNKSVSEQRNFLIFVKAAKLKRCVSCTSIDIVFSMLKPVIEKN